MYKYNKTKQEEIEELSIIDIYSYYLGIKINKIPISFKSPLRNETRSSFGIFIKDKKVLWKDFTLNEGGDIYKLIMRLYNISYNEAINKIYNDFINNKKQIQNSNITIINTNRIIYIQPYYYIKENIPQSYYDYWNEYKVITQELLDLNSVSCVKYLYSNYNLIEEYKDNDIIIGYKWKYKNELYHKFYFPFRKDKRFISDFRGTSQFLIHGLNRIDKTADYIIITKSVKDKMVLEGLNYNAVNIQNEGIKIPENVITELRKYYNKIYLLYDNDYDKKENWGQIDAKRIIKEYPFIINKKIDGRFKCSDISEYVKKYTIDETKKLLKQLII